MTHLIPKDRPPASAGLSKNARRRTVVFGEQGQQDCGVEFPDPTEPRDPDDEGAPGLPPERAEEFVRLLGQNQRRLLIYVMSLVPRWSDAEEVLQETNLVLWREFGSFRPGSNFSAWACRIALNRVLAWRKRQRRERLEFSAEFLEAVAEEITSEAERLEERSRLLARCIEKLPAKQRTMLRARYTEGRAIEAIAREAGRTADAVYRALSRTRQALHECVTRALEQRGRA